MVKCKRVYIPKNACYIQFWEGKKPKYSHTVDLIHDSAWPETIRGETFLIDFDTTGRIMGIELLGNDKPCQGGNANVSKRNRLVSKSKRKKD